MRRSTQFTTAAPTSRRRSPRGEQGEAQLRRGARGPRCSAGSRSSGTRGGAPGDGKRRCDLRELDERRDDGGSARSTRRAQRSRIVRFSVQELKRAARDAARAVRRDAARARGRRGGTLAEERTSRPGSSGWSRRARRSSGSGQVNLAAIDEFREQSERKEYLDRQLADLTDALATLEDAIRKIDRETKSALPGHVRSRQCRPASDKFPRLFGGGQAYLELVGDDVLESGVAIMARPPGKRNSSISQLSGGEKALTAVALVFSIFELNPAPFCLLDEVDAPLDENNVGRFCDIVREMSRPGAVHLRHAQQDDDGTREPAARRDDERAGRARGSSRSTSTRPCAWRRCNAAPMNELRWILLVAGVLLIVGLYVWGMRSRNAQRRRRCGTPDVSTGTADSLRIGDAAARDRSARPWRTIPSRADACPRRAERRRARRLAVANPTSSSRRGCDDDRSRPRGARRRGARRASNPRSRAEHAAADDGARRSPERRSRTAAAAHRRSSPCA